MGMKLVAIVVALGLLFGVGVVAQRNEQHQPVKEEQSLEDLPQKTAKTIASYYPIAKDSMWSYRSSDTDAAEVQVSVDFMKDNTYQVRYIFEDRTVVKVYLQEDDILYEVATVEDAFLKRDYTLLRQYKDVVLKLPIEQGERWILADGGVRTITAVGKTIETPMQQLDVVEVTTLRDGLKDIHYYAEKVGLVGYVHEGDEVTEKMLIQSYQTNHPMSTTIPVIYMNKETKEMELIEQTISIMTNEEPRHFLTDLLSIQPHEGIVQALPTDAEIRGIYSGEGEEKVVIDLSKGYEEYTSEEKQLAIQSVAQTIGQYYGVQEVALTVNQEVYKEGIEVRR